MVRLANDGDSGYGTGRGVTISGGRMSGGRASSSSTGGGDTGGYDPLGGGTVDDPTRGGKTIQDISGGDSNDQSYVDAIRQNVARQVKLSQDYRNLVDQGRNIDYQNYFDLARRGGIIPSQFGGGGLLGDAFNPMSFGFLGQLAGAIGRNASRQLMQGLEKGYIPQYNKIGQVVATLNPETGQYGAGSVVGRIDPNNPANTAPPPMDLSDDDGFVAPEATAVAAAEPEPEVSMVDPDLRYPAGGIYPEEGLYRRMGLLDIAPTRYGGLLAGYDQPQFEAMQASFQRPVDVGLFQDPYDVSGYTLI
jgi:hypothetical protein